MDSELVEVARTLIDARTDDANHTTGAAARTAGGRIVTGVNVFHFTGGPCAELVVIGSAAAEGAGNLVEIVAVGDGGRGILSPCGRCRQVLADYFPDIRVIVSTGREPCSVPVSGLLPWGNRWDPELGSIPVASSEEQPDTSSPGHVQSRDVYAPGVDQVLNAPVQPVCGSPYARVAGRPNTGPRRPGSTAARRPLRGAHGPKAGSQAKTNVIAVNIDHSFIGVVGPPCWRGAKRRFVGLGRHCLAG